jgi:hypothetical protein
LTEGGFAELLRLLLAALFSIKSWFGLFSGLLVRVDCEELEDEELEEEGGVLMSKL